MANVLSDTLNVINNNRDWAMKAYETSNQQAQVENQLRQVQVQEKAQNLTIGKQIADESYRIAKMQNGPLKKVALKNFEGQLQQMNVQYNPEYMAALQDPNIAPQMANSLIAFKDADDPMVSEDLQMLVGNMPEKDIVEALIKRGNELSKQKTAKTTAQSQLMAPIIQNALARPEAITPAGADTIAQAATNTQQFVQQPGAAGQVSSLIQGRAGLEQSDYSDKKSAELLDIQTKKGATPGYVLGQKAADSGALGSIEEGTGVLSKKTVDTILNDGKVKYKSVAEMLNAAQGAEGLVQDQGAQEKIKRLISAAEAEKAKQDKLKRKEDAEIDMGKEWDAMYKRYEPTVNALVSLQTLSKLKGNSVADNAMMGQLQVASEGVVSAIRAGDAARYGGSAGLADRFSKTVEELRSGAKYTPEMKRNIVQFTKVAEQYTAANMRSTGKGLFNRAKSRGVSIDNVFGEVAPVFTKPGSPLVLSSQRGGTIQPGSGLPQTKGSPNIQIKQFNSPAPAAPAPKLKDPNAAASQYLKYGEAIFQGPGAAIPEAQRKQIREAAKKGGQ